MKIISTITIVVLAFSLSAQTNVIRTKSHSGKPNGSLTEPDNFGIPAPSIRIDSVILYKENCLIEVSIVDGLHKYRDTICDHPYLQGMGTELKEIQKHYNKNTKFEGFKQSPKLERIDQSSRFNGTYLLGGICVTIALLFGISPITKR